MPKRGANISRYKEIWRSAMSIANPDERERQFEAARRLILRAGVERHRFGPAEKVVFDQLSADMLQLLAECALAPNVAGAPPECDPAWWRGEAAVFEFSRILAGLRTVDLERVGPRGAPDRVRFAGALNDVRAGRSVAAAELARLLDAEQPGWVARAAAFSPSAIVPEIDEARVEPPAERPQRGRRLRDRFRPPPPTRRAYQ